MRIKDSKDQYFRQLQRGLQLEAEGSLDAAKGIYLQILRDEPNNTDCLFRLGTLFNRAKHFNVAIEYWKVLLESRKNSPLALSGYADCLGGLGDLEAAASNYEKAIEYFKGHNSTISAEKKASVHMRLGLLYKELEKFDLMEEQLSKAIELNPGDAHAHGVLGYLCSVLGRPDEAKESYRKAIAIQPRGPACAWYRALADHKVHSEIDEDVLAMQKLYESPGTEDADKLHLAFGLGKVFDDLGRHHEAFEYWREGNRLHRALHPYDSKSDGTQVYKVLRKLYQSKFAAKDSGINEQKRPVFIVGMFRSGSTLIEQILASHSMVCAIGEADTLYKVIETEISEDLTDLFRLDKADWRRLGQMYLQELSERAGDKEFIVDKILSNYQNIGFIRMMFSSAKVVHCRREPMDIGFSAYKNLFAPGLMECSYDLEDLGQYYRKYERLMKHWHRAIPGFVYDIEYENVIAEPEREIRSLLEFLNLPFEEACLVPHKTKRPVITASLNQVRKPIYKSSVKSWKNYEKELMPLKKAMKGGLLDFLN